MAKFKKTKLLNEWFNEPRAVSDFDWKLLNEKFNNKIGKLINRGKHSFVFEWETDFVIKIKNNPNINYSDGGFYKTLKKGNIQWQEDVFEIDGKFLTVYNNTLFYVIMEKLTIDENLYNRLDDVEFAIKDFKTPLKKPALLWLFENMDNDGLLIDLLEHAEKNIFTAKQYATFLDTLSELLPLFSEIKKRKIKWRDIHKGNFGYNRRGQLVPFDMEF